MEVIKLILGFVVCILLAQPVLEFNYNFQTKITNYKNKTLSVALGMLLILTFFIVFFIESIFFAGINVEILFVFTTVFLLGYIDDVSNDNHNKGLKGHIRAISKGELTSGFIKAAGVPLTLLLYMGFSIFNIIEVFFLSLVVNLFNFFDLRPGRCQKVFILLFLPLTLLVDSSYNYLILGAVIVTLYLDLAEMAVLGDGGANLLGAVMAINVIKLPTDIRIGLYFSVLILTIVGEKYSYTNIIEKSKILTFIDEIGRIN
ncbi:hypothetical protein PRVXT_001115 [Proteinivorax tanatarense]|uniref:Phospho-N-acetylmuramoyl-pentapeptide-transferase n=1 Tax=Proteinivorax tanatarense TaxID=1260629 RepID=A0AAU7VPH2_9FIRM